MVGVREALKLRCVMKASHIQNESTHLGFVLSIQMKDLCVYLASIAA